MIDAITVADLPACTNPEPTTFIPTDSTHACEPIEQGRDGQNRVGNSPAAIHGATCVPPFESVLLRALMDIPAFADHVIPALDADLFDDEEAATIYTFIAEDYQRYHTAPDFNVLRVRNDHERGHNERTVKRVDASLRALQAMTPIQATQVPILMTETETWMRDRKVYTLLRRIVGATDSGTDPRPLTDQLRAAYDWRFTDGSTGRFMFKNRDALLNSAAAPFVVQNLIVQNSLVALVSPPGSNKTFLALDLALSIASGQSTWLGAPLHVAGPAVYVLGEGGGRFKLRVQAWDEQHGIEPSQSYPFHVLNEAVALTNRADADAFVQEVAALKPVLIVFDTLSRCLAGADENNQKDMSAAVGVCDTLRQQLGCCVVLLHHTTKGGDVERGSSVLRGAVDTLLVLKASDPSAAQFTMTCDKQKDAESFAPIYLAREQVTLMSERDSYTGDPVVSCVVKVASTAQASQHADQQLWKAQQFILKNPDASRRAVAECVGGRRTEAFQKISEWVSRGELRFRRRRTDPLASMRAEQHAGEEATVTH